MVPLSPHSSPTPCLCVNCSEQQRNQKWLQPPQFGPCDVSPERAPFCSGTLSSVLIAFSSPSFVFKTLHFSLDRYSLLLRAGFWTLLKMGDSMPLPSDARVFLMIYLVLKEHSAWLTAVIAALTKGSWDSLYAKKKSELCNFILLNCSRQRKVYHQIDVKLKGIPSVRMSINLSLHSFDCCDGTPHRVRGHISLVSESSTYIFQVSQTFSFSATCFSI